MKHAIMVEGHGSTANILQQTIDRLDDMDIDFFVHWDLNYAKPHLSALKSEIHFVQSVSVKWGTDTMILAELALFEAVYASGKYDYVHLIYANDIPLMTVQYFISFFEKRHKQVFIGQSDYDENTEHRVTYYYPFRHLNYRGKLAQKFVLPIVKRINALLHVNRQLGKSTVRKGPNWFSGPVYVIEAVLQYDDLQRFRHTYLGDEVLLQTVLANLSVTKNDNAAALRYIDWERGTPYLFGVEDVEELKSKVNTGFAFARKVMDTNVVMKIYDTK